MNSLINHKRCTFSTVLVKLRKYYSGILLSYMQAWLCKMNNLYSCYTTSAIFYIMCFNYLVPLTMFCLLFVSMKELQGDAIAGTTVALTVIPQGLALAQLAELPPQVG